MATVTVSKLEAQTVLIDGYPIDVTTGETHTFPLEVTSYPVEKGADIADHVRAKPLKVSLDCIISDTPIGAVATHATRKDGSVPSGVIYQKLLTLRENANPIVISTSLDVFEDMVLSDMSIPRESGEPHQLHVKLEFTQIIFVTNNRTTIRVSTPGGTGHKDLGERLAALDPGSFLVYSLRDTDPEALRRLDNPFLAPVLHDHATTVGYPPGTGFFRFHAVEGVTLIDGFVDIDEKGTRVYTPLKAKFVPGGGFVDDTGEKAVTRVGAFNAAGPGQFIYDLFK